MNVTKSQPLTKEEVMQLVNLVEANSIVTSKATNASNNQLKETAWLQITDHFNSLISSCPRKPEQLRLKWENLKKSARKRSTKIRMNNLKTGGGKADYIPPDEALDKVAAILGATCEGYTVPFGGDAEVVDVGSNIEEQMLIVPFPECGDGVVKENSDGVDSDVNEVPKITEFPLGTPKNKKIFFSSGKCTGRQKKQKQATEDVQARINRNNAIANYYITKKNVIEKIGAKIQLEIEILNNKKTNML